VGSVRESDPFQISSLSDLKWLSESPVAWGDGVRLVHHIQTADIDATETRYWNDGAGFTPIAFEDGNAFVGHYDGNGYHIYGLHISPKIDRSMSHIGMFSILGGSIQNLNLINLNINIEDDINHWVYIGGIAGSKSHSVIKNSTVSGNIKLDISAWNISVGGIAGDVRNTEIHQTSVNVNISLNSRSNFNSVGGIAGRIDRSIITNSYFTGDISNDGETSYLKSGGLVGSTCEWNTTIENSYVTSINKMTGVLGGIAGSLANIFNSFWNVEATGITMDRSAKVGQIFITP